MEAVRELQGGASAANPPSAAALALHEVTGQVRLQEISSDMSWVERIERRVSNINALCDATRIAMEMLGAELAACKWSFEYLLDEKAWRKGEPMEERTWAKWLNERKFVITAGEKEVKVDDKVALSLMAFSSCCETIRLRNEERRQEGLPLLPEPKSASHIEPYQGLLDRVDDWEPSDMPEGAAPQAFGTKPPYADRQPRFLEKWEAVWTSLPVEKKIDKTGAPIPPPQKASGEYLRQERRLLSEDASPHSEEDLEAEVVNVGAKARIPAGPPKARPAPPPAPKLTERELAEMRAEARQKELARQYRDKILKAQQAAEELEGCLAKTIAEIGDEGLARLRHLDLGAWSVADDIALIEEIGRTIFKARSRALGSIPSEPAPTTRERGEEVIDVTVS